MLSHKWTFSLQILIVMLVLGFAASSTIAAEFSTTLSVDDSVDISFAEGVQVEYGAQGGATETVTINVSFGEVVNHDVVLAANADPSKDFADNDFQIIAYNRFGGTETPPVIADDDINPGSPTPATPADGKNFTIDLSKPEADSGIVRVLVRMPKHVVEVADPRAYLDDEGKRTVDGKNAAASIEIHYVIPANRLLLILFRLVSRWCSLLTEQIVGYVLSLLPLLMSSLHLVRNLARIVSRRIKLMFQTRPLAIRFF